MTEEKEKETEEGYSNYIMVCSDGSIQIASNQMSLPKMTKLINQLIKKNKGRTYIG